MAIAWAPAGGCWICSMKFTARDGAVEQRHVENAPALVFACRGRTNSERQSELPAAEEW